MKRCGLVCERCAKRAAEHVHHRIPVRMFKRLADAHGSENLAAVCTVCHAVEHRHLALALPLIALALAERENLLV